MFSDESLHFLRKHEVEALSRHILPRSRVLELGAGTGWQAKALAELGHYVTAIDLPTSKHSKGRVFPVQDYDGVHIPFPHHTFDVVFSSNVLEHVPHLDALLAEIRRVLKPNGYCIHAMPTTAWRMWSDIGGLIDLFNVLRSGRSLRQMAGAAMVRLQLTQHGAKGNAFTEYWHFRKSRWLCDFQRNGFHAIHVETTGIFYTGWMVLGPKLSMRYRKRLAAVLGGSCRAYIVKPFGE